MLKTTIRNGPFYAELIATNRYRMDYYDAQVECDEAMAIELLKDLADDRNAHLAHLEAQYKIDLGDLYVNE